MMQPAVRDVNELRICQRERFKLDKQRFSHNSK